MARVQPQGPDIIARALAKNRLGVPSVVFFGVAGAAPLTVIIGSITTIYAIIGSTAVPIAYVVVAGLLSLFTVGFVAMSRHIVNTGAFYSYISHGLGRMSGVGAAFVALPAYSLMQIGLFGLFGSAASGILAAGIGGSRGFSFRGNDGERSRAEPHQCWCAHRSQSIVIGNFRSEGP